MIPRWRVISVAERMLTVKWHLLSGTASLLHSDALTSILGVAQAAKCGLNQHSLFDGEKWETGPLQICSLGL